MYDPNIIARNTTKKGYELTLLENYEGKFMITMTRPNGKRAVFDAGLDLCKGNYEYNNLIKLYS